MKSVVKFGSLLLVCLTFAACGKAQECSSEMIHELQNLATEGTMLQGLSSNADLSDFQSFLSNYKSFKSKYSGTVCTYEGKEIDLDKDFFNKLDAALSQAGL